MEVKNQKSKIVRGRIYYIFPVKIDIYKDGVPDVIESWEWKYFNWFFDIINFTIGVVLQEESKFLIKLNKKDLNKLTTEEKEMLQ